MTVNLDDCYGVRDKLREAKPMMHMKLARIIIAAGLLTGMTAPLGSEQQVPRDPAAAALGPVFSSEFATLDGVRLHYVRGGSGPTLILLHGFPQDWYEWHRIMPRLAKQFTVIAPDLRGVGRSVVTSGGYDAATLAADVHGLVQHLKLQDVYVAGHDIGGMTAYTYARLYPADVRGVMILDVLLPGLRPWDEMSREPRLWHFHFHQTLKVPELLIDGRQAGYFRAFFDRFARHADRITDAEVERYAAAYMGSRLHAGLEFYRAFPANEQFNRQQRERLTVPIVLAGGEYTIGPRLPQIAGALLEVGCLNVVSETIQDSGHYVVDEQPTAVANLLERYGLQRSAKY